MKFLSSPWWCLKVHEIEQILLYHCVMVPFLCKMIDFSTAYAYTDSLLAFQNALKVLATRAMSEVKMYFFMCYSVILISWINNVPNSWRMNLTGRVYCSRRCIWALQLLSLWISLRVGPDVVLVLHIHVDYSSKCFLLATQIKRLSVKCTMILLHSPPESPW